MQRVDASWPARACSPDDRLLWEELAAVGNPHYTWNGGGTNQIQYDHCLADGLLQKYEGKPSGLPLQVLSMRTLQY